jgi:flavin reductase (DIM6/NTAB) family NADH-FMN oxidoreductase RutF
MADPARPAGLRHEALRGALGNFATGVAIVTTMNDDGELCGLTANSFTSVSLEPPLVLVCVRYAARSYRAITESGRFAVHILRDDQMAVAQAFAAGGKARDGICRWRPNDLGYARLESYHAVFECRLEDEHRGGDHAILIGAVEGLDVRDDGAAPLIFYRGRFFGLEASAA